MLYELKVVELPVVALLDMESASLLVRQGNIQTIRCSVLIVRISRSVNNAHKLARTQEGLLHR
jgi:hypothetical protein